MSPPIVSFIVLSYNNARFIRRTLDSIFAQTVDDFEIILIDDGSTDNSVDIIKTYDDARLRLFAHSENKGLTPRYNEAVSHARGAFLVNLDTDDYIHPEKSAKQLACFAADETLGVVGSFIELIDEHDQPHPQAALMEGMVNQAHDFNDPAAWVVQNNLVRSSTMMRRELHERVGPNEVGMLRAPDFDLWTRGLQAGFRFHVLPERLTSYRLHSGGLTYGDPKATFLELSYATLRRLLPMISARGEVALGAKAMDWMMTDPQFLALPAPAAERLAGLLGQAADPGAYLDYLRYLDAEDDADDLIRRTGRRLMELRQGLAAQTAGLQESLDWQIAQHENWKREADAKGRLIDELRTLLEAERRSCQALQTAVDWHNEQHLKWQAEADNLRQRIQNLETALEGERQSNEAAQAAVAWHAEQVENWKRELSRETEHARQLAESLKLATDQA